MLAHTLESSQTQTLRGNRSESSDQGGVALREDCTEFGEESNPRKQRDCSEGIRGLSQTLERLSHPLEDAKSHAPKTSGATYWSACVPCRSTPAVDRGAMRDVGS